MYLDKRKVITLIVIITIIILIFLLTIPKNCKTDEECFNLKASKCSKAKVTIEKELDIYNFEILGKKADNCIIEVTLIKVSETKELELKQALEGKSMRCTISQETLKEQSIKEIDNLNEYCTGQLKEAIIQLNLDKLYEIVVKNIGSLATDFRHLLE